MYPACILHVFRCVLSRYIKIHQDTSRYICICHFGYDDGIETFRQPQRYVSCMYPACIPHVSRMCQACILITTEDTCIPHVSRMCPACIPHVSLHIRYIYLRMHLRYMYLTMYLTMYLGCILKQAPPAWIYREYAATRSTCVKQVRRWGRAVVGLGSIACVTATIHEAGRSGPIGRRWRGVSGV
jgi:hypothetical protein